MLHGPWVLSIVEHHFLSTLIGAQSIVVDLGAHLGEFSTEVSRRFGCRCYGAEPHPVSHSRICQSDLISVLNCAIAPVDAPVRLNVSTYSESHSLRPLPRSGVGSIEVDGITFQRFMETCRIDQINLMKVDIEGSEVELLESLPKNLLDRIDQMTVAFHDFKPEFDLTAKVRATLNRLIGLGWLPIVFSRRDNSDVLLINRNKIGLSSFQLTYFKYAARYVDGFLRVVGRKLGGRRNDSTPLEAKRPTKTIRTEADSASSSLRGDLNMEE
jgi:FkbM family methyltransferase